MTFQQHSPAIPLPYRIFLLYIEPVSTLVGAFYAHFRQHTYLLLTHAATAPKNAAAVPIGTSVVLSQLANLYLLFALNEALVLRATDDIRVWKVFVLGLLLADFGHVYSVAPVGIEIYWRFWTWNAIDWGNLGFVYLGATTRICFLLGLGVDHQVSSRGRVPKEKELVKRK